MTVLSIFKLPSVRKKHKIWDKSMNHTTKLTFEHFRMKLGDFSLLTSGRYLTDLHQNWPTWSKYSTNIMPSDKQSKYEINGIFDLRWRSKYLRWFCWAQSANISDFPSHHTHFFKVHQPINFRVITCRKVVWNSIEKWSHTSNWGDTLSLEYMTTRQDWQWYFMTC